MKYLKAFTDQESAVGEYPTPLVCLLKNSMGKLLCIDKSWGDIVRIEKDNNGFIKAERTTNNFQFDITPLDLNYKLIS